MLRCVATLAITSIAVAQTPLTTLYAGGNGLGGNTAVYFDLTVQAPVQITQLDVNALGGTGASVIEFWTVPTTWVGNDTNPAAWTLMGSSASVAAQAQGTPTVAPITSPFLLAPGTYGVAITYVGTLGPAYTNGTGTNQVYSTNELTLSAGASGGIFTGAVNNPRVWNGSIHYIVQGSGTFATATNYGTGCVAKAASFYEHFTTTPSIDLSNTAFQMINTGPGYIVLPSTTAFVTPSATATNLNLGDDTETSVTLSAPFTYPGGTTTTLNVASNGHISTATNSAAGDYTPTPAEFLNWPNATWAVWRDMICNATGNVWFEEVGGIAYITWLNVIGYVGQTAGTTPTTFQLQFNLTTGTVDFVFQSMDTVSVSTWTGGEGWVVGYSPAGASMDPGSIDLSTALPASITLEANDRAALAFAASARPIVGNTINLITSNIGATAPFGAILLGFGNPALDLTGLGMAGCTQYTDNLVTLLFLPFGAPTNSFPFSVPNMVGLSVNAQSFVYDPAANLTALGAISSNGVTLLFGSF
jgi:hypothetical protein